MTDNRIQRRKRWLSAAVKLAIVALVVWFIRDTLIGAWEDLERHSFQVDFRWLICAGFLYLLGTLPCAVFWHRGLRALGQPVGFIAAARAYYVGHLGKYVPGKAMVVVLRAGLVRRPGVDASLAVAGVFLETLTMMCVGALLGAVVAALRFRGEPLLFWPALGAAAVAGLPTLPPVFRRLVRWIAAGKLDPAATEKLGRLGFPTVLLGWGLNAIGWAILGLSLWAVLKAMGEGAGGEYFLYLAAVSLGTVAGFISMVPGGAVVREAVLTRLIASCLGGGTALIAAVLLRLVWLVTEIGVSGILYISSHRENALKPPPRE